MNKIYRFHPLTVLFSLSKYFWVLLVPITRAVLAYGFDFANAFKGYGADLAVISALLLWAVLRWRCSYISVGGNTVRLQKGIIIKKSVQVNFSDSTVIRLSQNPFTRLFFCYRLTVFSDCSYKPLIKARCTKECAAHIKAMLGFSEEINSRVRFSPVLYSLLSGKSIGGFWLIYAGVSVLSVLSGKTLTVLAKDNIVFITKIYSSLPDFLFYGLLFLFIARTLSFITDLMSVHGYSVSKKNNTLYITKGIIKHDYYRILAKNGYFLSTNSIFCYKKYSLYAGISGLDADKYDSNLLLPMTDKHTFSELLLYPKIDCYATGCKFIHISTSKRTFFSYIWQSLLLFVLSCFTAGVYFSLYGTGLSSFLGFILPVPFLLRLIEDIVNHSITQVNFDGSCLNLRYFKSFCIQRVIINPDNIARIRLKQNPFQRHRRLCDFSVYVKGEKMRKFTVKQLNYKKCAKICENLC